jgi:hypothetical protein
MRRTGQSFFCEAGQKFLMYVLGPHSSALPLKDGSVRSGRIVIGLDARKVHVPARTGIDIV